MFKSLRFLWLLLALLSCSYAQSASVDLTLDQPLYQQLPLKPHLSIWKGELDASPSEVIDSVQFFALWQDLEPETHVNTWKDKLLRLKFHINNRSKTDQQLVLIYPETTLDEIHLTYLDNGSVIRKYRAGNQLPFNSRPIKHRHFAFPIDIKAGQELTIVLEASGMLDTRILDDFSVWPRELFFETTDTDLLVNALHFGVLLVFSIYSFLLFSAVRETSYLWFSLYTLSLLIRALTLNNIAFEFVWPFTPVMQNLTIIMSVMFSTALTALFAITYLGINDKTPRVFMAYKLYLLSHLLMMLYQAYTGWSLASINVWLLFAGVASLLIWAHAFILYRQQHAYAGSFVLAFSFLILGGFFSASNLFFSHTLPTPLAADIGQLIYIAIISIALSMRIGHAREKAHLIYAENKAKSDFMAKMSHEIRTPINGVLGMAQLLSSTELSIKQKHYADVINHCGKTLLNVINDILEYAKIEAGKLVLENRTFNIDELLRKNNAVFWPQIQSKNLGYHYELDPKVPHYLVGDPERLQQVLNNLFSNAVKFTRHGHLQLNIKLLYLEHEEVAHIEFRISDTGIGMSPDEVEGLFTPFSQANNNTSRHYGGSGLGLNISKQLISLMGGEITVKSQVGEGTEFRILLPMKIDLDKQADYIQENSQLHGKRVMALAEASSKQAFVSGLLSDWGMTVKTFTDYHQAELYMQDDEHSFDLYILSHNVLQNLSPIERTHVKQLIDKTLFFDCTYQEQVTHLQGFEQANVVLSPFSHDTLRYQVFERLGLSKPEIVNAPLPQEKLQKRSDIKALVVEDDATNRLVIRAILKQMHIEHDIVVNGQLALECYQQKAEEYDVILMDCEMPEMNGYQASIKIRELEKQMKKPGIPIIALTAHILPEYEKRCYDSGMNKIIAKPIDLQELSDALDNLKDV